MAMSNQRIGEVVGYSSNTSTNKETGVVTTYHNYYVLVKQRVDKATKLPTEVGVFTVTEKAQVLGDKLAFGTKVSFWEEVREWRANGVMQRASTCGGLELV